MEDPNSMPIDILIELVIGLSLSVIAGVYNYAVFKDVNAITHIKKSPQSEFNFARTFVSGKTTLAATIAERMPKELIDLNPSNKNATLAKFIDA